MKPWIAKAFTVAIVAMLLTGCASLPDWRLRDLHIPDLSLADVSLPDWRPWRHRKTEEPTSAPASQAPIAQTPTYVSSIIHDEPASPSTKTVDLAPARFTPPRLAYTPPDSTAPLPPIEVQSERLPPPSIDFTQSSRTEADTLLERTVEAYKRFDYRAALHWAERVLAHPATIPRQRFEARIWAGAAAYLNGDEPTARQYFHLAHLYAPNAAFPRASFPARIENLYDKVCQQYGH